MSCWTTVSHAIVIGDSAATEPRAGWASTERDASGNIQPAKDQFPSGIPSLREYVQGAGMELGLYTCAGECESPPPREKEGVSRCDDCGKVDSHQ